MGFALEFKNAKRRFTKIEREIMSHVASVVLLTFIDDGGIKDVQDWLSANGWPQLVKVSDHAGGSKHMQCDVWMAAINYFDIEAFAAVVSAVVWRWPESVQLLVKGEHDDHFTLRSGVAPE